MSRFNYLAEVEAIAHEAYLKDIERPVATDFLSARVVTPRSSQQGYV